MAEKDANASPAKKAKADSRLEAVEAALKQVATLPESARLMLLVSLPNSLAVAADERHDVQHAVVKMISEVIQGVEEGLEAAVAEEESKVASVEGSKAELEAEALGAEAAVALAKEEVAARKELLAVSVVAKQESQAKFVEKQKAQKAGDVALDEAGSKKAAIDNVLDTNLKVILEGDWTVNWPDDEYKALMVVVDKSSVDSSLLAALPAVCKKTAAERRTFDKMVLDHVEKHLVSTVAELAKLMEDGAAAKAERAAAVEAAQQDVDAATDANVRAAADFKAVEEASKAAAAAAKRAATALASYEHELKKATAALDEKVAVLESFRLYNKANFELLRDRVTKPAQEIFELPPLVVTEAALKEVGA